MIEELPLNTDTLKAFYLKANRHNRRAMNTLLRKASKQAYTQREYEYFPLSILKHTDYREVIKLKRVYVGEALSLLNVVLMPVARKLSNG